jgi:hypothetical protein
VHLHPLQIIIVDEFTGRTMPGRRWSDGLHQAIEAKESLEIQNESITLASISYQVWSMPAQGTRRGVWGQDGDWKGLGSGLVDST